MAFEASYAENPQLESSGWHVKALHGPGTCGQVQVGHGMACKDLDS